MSVRYTISIHYALIQHAMIISIHYQTNYPITIWMISFTVHIPVYNLILISHLCLVIFKIIEDFYVSNSKLFLGKIKSIENEVCDSHIYSSNAETNTVQNKLWSVFQADKRKRIYRNR